MARVAMAAGLLCLAPTTLPSPSAVDAPVRAGIEPTDSIRVVLSEVLFAPAEGDTAFIEFSSGATGGVRSATLWCRGRHRQAAPKRRLGARSDRLGLQ
jgi:hypothetical protein